MRRWIVRSLKIALLLAALFALDSYVNRYEYQAAARRRSQFELAICILPKVELRDATFEEALSYLRTEALKAGWKGELRFVIPGEAELAKRYRAGLTAAQLAAAAPQAGSSPSLNPHRPWLKDAPPTDGRRNPVTISLSRISLLEACREVSSLAGHHMSFGDRVVEFTPGDGSDGTYEPIVTRTFRTRVFDQWKLDAKLPNGRFDLRAELHDKYGFQFYEGTCAEYDAKKGRLVFVNTEEFADWAIAACAGRDPREFPQSERFRWWLYTLFHREKLP